MENFHIIFVQKFPIPSYIEQIISHSTSNLLFYICISCFPADIDKKILFPLFPKNIILGAQKFVKVKKTSIMALI